MTSPRETIWLNIILSFLLAGLLSYFFIESYQSFKWGTAGAYDFIQYWSAHLLAQSGQPIYDPQGMLELQHSVAPAITKPIMMWNPPWLLLLMKPLLGVEFSGIAKLFFFVNIALCGATSIVLWRIYSGNRQMLLPSILLGYLFFPVWNVFFFGQVSLILSLTSATLLYGLVKEHNPLVGITLALLTIKFHLFYLIYLVVAWWVIATRRWSIIVWAGATLASLIVLTDSIWPGISMEWIQSITLRTSDAIPKLDWIVATSVGFVRLALSRAFGVFTTAPTFIIPCITALTVLCYFIRERPIVQWHILFPPLLCLSLFTSPYGWVYDQAVLVVVPISILSQLAECGLKSRPSLELVAFYLLLHAVCIFLFFWTIKYQHELFWIPLALLFMWWRATRLGLCKMVLEH